MPFDFDDATSSNNNATNLSSILFDNDDDLIDRRSTSVVVVILIGYILYAVAIVGGIPGNFYVFIRMLQLAKYELMDNFATFIDL